MPAELRCAIDRDRSSRRAKSVAGFALIVMTLACFSHPLRDALAAADGPDFWNVTGVRPGGSVRVRAAANERSAIVTRLPHDAKGLKNLGCMPAPDFAEWQKLSDAAKALSIRARWCRIESGGRQGWVPARFLTEGASPAATPPESATFGPWRYACASGECVLEQAAAGRAADLVMRLEPRPGGNARIEVRGSAPFPDGTLTILIDGKVVSAGPVAPLRAGDGSRLVMPPDDVTLGLVRQMQRGRKLVLRLVGAVADAELSLSQFPEAWRRATRTAGRSPR